MKTITKLKKGCGRRTEAQYKHYIRGINCGEFWDRKGEICYCPECEAKLQTLQEVCVEIRVAFNICSNGMLNIVKEKPRDNNTQRDWEQRIDELILLYSNLNGLSNNEAKEELLKKFKGEEK